MSIAVAGALFGPVRAAAQAVPAGADAAAGDPLTRLIQLDVKSANLYYALTLLFDQLNVSNYTIPEPMKRMEVSAHFTNLPLRTALETLLKNSGYTYNVEGGVYSVVPRAEEKPDLPVEVARDEREPVRRGKQIYRLYGTQIISNVVDLATRLGARILPSTVGSGVSSQSLAGSFAGRGGLGGGSLGSGGGFGGGLGGFAGSGTQGGGFGGGLGGFAGLGSSGSIGSGFGGQGGLGRGGGGF
jgi:hypothetical protein